ncbi:MULTISPECIES: outer membrane beta-barrel protein [unclassified Mucilaginibacter]|uniref:outer membrane beta-barrel protein n=1 Tax=unclassified Mucilaginibacter TaxID=2617802 RepID=UPI002AC90DFC|nr:MULTISPECIES: outer membrane beta-barrel protein [unclassified Mucilaginibacter]MEB0280805.1 outer membrane beta-barrel protein [Mucilaginibacter sp. 10B2]MEB0302267.1 outer membrane beta-barrel protein [Mucilaginibacter sp. 5C4]WPX25677.1 outer membrane beta-barrel protein [Mucilaginibacter sp. 5C4]
MNISAKMRKPETLCMYLSGLTVSNKQIIRQLMRVSVVVTLIISTTFQVLMATSTKGQNMHTDKVTISLQDESLSSGLKKIEQQTSLRFYYRKADIKTLTGLNMPLGTRTVEQTLQELLQNTFFSFRQIDDNILLEKNSQQSGYEITGRVVDLHRKAVEFATISIQKVSNNQKVQTTQADTSGHYKLMVSEKGDYLISISAVGMDSLSVALTLSEKIVVQIPDIVLSPNTKQLKEVTITGKKAFIEQKIDRTVVNVGAIISNDGANALEVLEKSPGVVVDGTGKINFRGKSGVLVLIDGKPTYLSGDNLTSYLKTLPASSLNQIELMDNPPAKYDASGNAGVINIITKRSKAAGFNGSLSASYGQADYGQTSESLNLNYRVNKLNLFANASYGINKIYRQIDIDRNYFDNNGNATSGFEQTQYVKVKNNNTNLKLGMDYYLSSKTTLGVVFTGSLSPSTLDNPSENKLYNGNQVLNSVVIAQNNSKSHFTNGGVNLNYSHKFDSIGRSLTFDLDYLKYDTRSNQSFLNQTYNPAGILTATQVITDNLPTNINIYTAKVDYSNPLIGNAKIDAGLKSSYVNTDNAANYFDVNNGLSTINYNLSNQFLYNENINAAYINYSKSIKRFSLQSGLRLENTNANGYQLGNKLHADSAFVRHYTNLFPTVFVLYKLDSAGTKTLVASYGRRIGRPYYQDLNPFILLADKYTYSAGNPYLLSQFSDNFKLAYNYKSLFSTALYYNHISDLQSELVRQQGNVFIDATGNIGTATYIGASVNISLEPTKWWFLNTYMQVFRTYFEGQLYASYLNQGLIFGEGNMTNQFTLPNGWSLELSGNYVMRRTTGQQINYPVGQLNAGIQKKILHNQGSIRLNGRDILHTYTSDGIINFIPNATASFRNRFNSQIFTLGFSYNFGKAVTNKKRNIGSADSEKGRVKN